MSDFSGVPPPQKIQSSVKSRRFSDGKVPSARLWQVFFSSESPLLIGTRPSLTIGTAFGARLLVMQALGHADVKTTQIYLEFPEGFLKDVFSDWIPDVKNRLQNLDKNGARA